MRVVKQHSALEPFKLLQLGTEQKCFRLKQKTQPDLWGDRVTELGPDTQLIGRGEVAGRIYNLTRAWKSLRCSHGQAHSQRPSIPILNIL
jgi:hypothetical protein